MKRIVAIVGVRGAGKSTLLTELGEYPHLLVLKPTTNRPRRGGSEEYDFVDEFPHGNSMEWTIEVGGFKYGVTRARVKSIRDGQVGVTVFDPGSMHVLEEFRQRWSGEVVTVGLDTIETVDEQGGRVANDANRTMSKEDFDKQRQQVLKSDIVLRGNADLVRKATVAVFEILLSRGGLVGSNWLIPLIAAGALLDGADSNQIEPASYDLRMGREVWCQGKRHQLTAEEPFFKIPPYSYAIVKAEEIAKIPCFMVGRFDLTVSLFFKGVLLSNGPQVDPGYHGALFCTLFNGRDVHADLKMGDHFATLEFTTLGSRVEGYRGQHQRKEGINQFHNAETGAGPGGNIVGRIEELEKGSKGRFIAVALLILGLIGAPSAVQIAMVSGLNERVEEIIGDVKSDAEREAKTIIAELSQETKDAHASLSDEAGRIDSIRTKIDEMNERLELLDNELDVTEQRSSARSGDAP